MVEQLCYACRTQGKVTCAFREVAANIAQDSHLDPLQKSVLIAESRIEARKCACPHLNNIDPDYPGRREL